MNAVLFNRRKYMVKRLHPEGSPKSIADATITLSADSFSYTGSPITPTGTVVYDGATLTVNTDYTISYHDNTNVGAATAVFTGIGEYEGSQVKTFQITSAQPTPSWDFSLADSSVHATASARIMDSGATWLADEYIESYMMQELPNGDLHISAPAQGHSYIWGFAAGHPMEISYLESACKSRRTGTPYYKSASFSDNGSKFYYCAGETAQERRGLHQFDTSAHPFAFTDTYNGGVTVSLSAVPYHFAFSHDGLHFYYDNESKTIYHRKLSTAWDLTSYDPSIEAETSYSRGLPIFGLQVSPDNLHLYAISSHNSWDIYNRKIVRYDMQTSGDITSMTIGDSMSDRMYYSGSAIWGLSSLLINSAGTKAIVWRQGETSANRYGYEFTLST